MVWEYAEEHVEEMDTKQRAKVKTLQNKYPNIRMDYAVAIALHLKDEDWDVFEMPSNELPDVKAARKRLEMAGLENYDKPDFKFKTYGKKAENDEAEERPKEIDYPTLNRCIDKLIGTTFTRKNAKTGENENVFVPGELANTYMKAEKLEEAPSFDRSKYDKEKLATSEKLQKKLAAEAKEWRNKINEINNRNREKRAKAAEKVYNQYKAIITDIKSGEISAEQANYIIDQLKAEHMEVRDKAAQTLKDAKKAVPFAGVLEGEVAPEVWKRDPSVDLSYTSVNFGANRDFSEFFCCAFLGGCNDSAAADYFKNGAISMVDFKGVEDGDVKRLVRAITAACVEREKGGKLSRKTYMLVDSVEGSDRVDPAIVYDALIDYAKQSGFDAVLFNKHACNNTPQKFNDFLGKQKVKTGKRRLEAMYSADGGERYLEGFGGWSFPANEVDGYVINLDGSESKEDTQEG